MRNHHWLMTAAAAVAAYAGWKMMQRDDGRLAPFHSGGPNRMRDSPSAASPLSPYPTAVDHPAAADVPSSNPSHRPRA